MYGDSSCFKSWLKWWHHKCESHLQWISALKQILWTWRCLSSPCNMISQSSQSETPWKRALQRCHNAPGPRHPPKPSWPNPRVWAPCQLICTPWWLLLLLMLVVLVLFETVFGYLAIISSGILETLTWVSCQSLKWLVNIEGFFFAESPSNRTSWGILKLLNSSPWQWHHLSNG